MAEVYDDERHIGEIAKPPVGQKLNKPAVIKLNNMKPRANQTVAAKEQALKRALAKDPDGAQHISYDSYSFVWEFKVEHFTKWGADDDDDEDEQ